MTQSKIKNLLSQIYLALVPLFTIVFGLGVGYIGYKIYLPIWLLNVFFMSVAIWWLSNSTIKREGIQYKNIVISAILFIIPTMLTSMFFGLGAPPYESPELWIKTLTEQRARYYILLAAGLIITFGFSILCQQLKKAGEDLYSAIGMVAIQIAAPVFIINMSFWGFYLPRLYQQMVKLNTTTLPEWIFPMRTMFYYINVFASALIYLAVINFSMSLKKTSLLKSTTCNIYICISALFLVLDLLPPSLPEPFSTLNFIVSIPAVPFMLPYFMGINLLSRKSVSQFSEQKIILS
jgi:hypothetical protein